MISSQLATLAQSSDEQPEPLPTSTPLPPLTEDVEAEKDGNTKITNDYNEEVGGMVDIFDLSFVAGRYGSDNSSADLNGDGTVDIFDISILGSHYGKPEPEIAAASIIATPEPLPIVTNGAEDDDFSDVIATVESETGEISAQSYYAWRSLKVGIGIDQVKTWDHVDGQTNTPPDFYAVASVGNVYARTATVHNAYEIYPYWRLGWWQYQRFPQFNYHDRAGDAYYIPISLQIRDDDGYICYGYLGCKQVYDVADISLNHGTRIKTMRFYPSSCRVVDEAGVTTQGGYNNNPNRCRVYLHAYGNEWPRAETKFYVDALWQ